MHARRLCTTRPLLRASQKTYAGKAEEEKLPPFSTAGDKVLKNADLEAMGVDDQYGSMSDDFRAATAPRAAPAAPAAPSVDTPSVDVPSVDAPSVNEPSDGPSDAPAEASADVLMTEPPAEPPVGPPADVIMADAAGRAADAPTGAAGAPTPPDGPAPAPAPVEPAQRVKVVQLKDLEMALEGTEESAPIDVERRTTGTKQSVLMGIRGKPPADFKHTWDYTGFKKDIPKEHTARSGETCYHQRWGKFEFIKPVLNGMLLGRFLVAPDDGSSTGLADPLLRSFPAKQCFSIERAPSDVGVFTADPGLVEPPELMVYLNGEAVPALTNCCVHNDIKPGVCRRPPFRAGPPTARSPPAPPGRRLIRSHPI